MPTKEFVAGQSGGASVVPAQSPSGLAIPSQVIGTPPANIPTRPNRQAFKGYNGLTPVVPLAAPAVTFRPRVTRAPAGIADDQVRAIFDAHHYVNVSSARGIAISNAFATMVLPRSDSFRALLAIRCVGANAIYVEFDADASTDSIYRLTQNQILLFDAVVPQGDVSIISDTGASTVSLSYANTNY